MERNGSTVVTATKSAYSSEELEEFKQIILGKLGIARADLELLTEAYTDNNHHVSVLDQGRKTLSKEENSRLAARQRSFINNLENALVRIENGTYGICRETGKLISKERLRAVPHATLCVAIKKKMNGNSILSKHY